MTFLNLHSPFFEPLWRRIATVVFCAVWAAFEFVSGSALWGMLVLAIGFYAALQFFVCWKKPDE